MPYREILAVHYIGVDLPENLGDDLHISQSGQVHWMMAFQHVFRVDYARYFFG